MRCGARAKGNLGRRPPGDLAEKNLNRRPGGYALETGGQPGELAREYKCYRGQPGEFLILLLPFTGHLAIYIAII